MKQNRATYWRGAFGDAYVDRNPASAESLEKREWMWRRILASIADALPQTILEVGANIGINLRALQRIFDADLYALEPNERARTIPIEDGVLAAERVFDGVAQKIPLPDSQSTWIYERRANSCSS